jgi:hypothetical protein
MLRARNSKDKYDSCFQDICILVEGICLYSNKYNTRQDTINRGLTNYHLRMKKGHTVTTKFSPNSTVRFQPYQWLVSV